jgi:hypothetical protein
MPHPFLDTIQKWACPKFFGSTKLFRFWPYLGHIKGQGNRKLNHEKKRNKTDKTSLDDKKSKRKVLS